MVPVPAPAPLSAVALDQVMLVGLLALTGYTLPSVPGNLTRAATPEAPHDCALNSPFSHVGRLNSVPACVGSARIAAIMFVAHAAVDAPIRISNSCVLSSVVFQV